MVFGYNYGTVNPAPILTVDNCTAQLNWELQDENRWSLQLTQECESLQGLHLQAELPDGVTVQVMPGNLLGNQTSPVFLKNANDQILDIGLAVLGHNKSFNGVGELLIVTLSETVEVLFPEIEARDVSNDVLTVKLDTSSLSSVGQLPTSIALGGNYPNPFNPMTTIEYDLPSAQRVRLLVYTVDGRLVRSLVNATVPGGHHQAVWQGRDEQGRIVPSGVYFYRLEAGSFSQTQRMLLLK